MFNSRNLGALIVDQAPRVRSWDKPQYSIQNLGIEESYGFGVLNEGQAIAVAKNVRVRQNEMSTPARPIISIGSDGTGFEHPEGRVGAGSGRRRGGALRRAALGASPLSRCCRVGIRCWTIRSRRRIRSVPAWPCAIPGHGPGDLGPGVAPGFLGGLRCLPSSWIYCRSSGWLGYLMGT